MFSVANVAEVKKKVVTKETARVCASILSGRTRSSTSVPISKHTGTTSASLSTYFSFGPFSSLNNVPSKIIYRKTLYL